MDEAQNIESSQIKVNKLPLDKEKYIPYSKYIKNDYPQLIKVVPKHSILYKVKYKPEIKIHEINEYFQKSHDIKANNIIKDNTVIDINDSCNHNMKLYNELKSNYNSADYINYYKRENNLTEGSENKVAYIKIDDEDKYDNGKRLTNYIPSTKKILTQNNNENVNIIYNSIYKNNNLDASHSYLYNKFNKNNTIDINKYDNNNKDIKDRKTFNTTKYDKYRHKNLSLGFFDLYNKMNGEASETSVESLSNKGNQNKINKIILFSGKKIKNYIDKVNIENKSYNANNINNNFNKDDSTILKMKIYRVKLFNEFFKHFQKFYKIFIKKYIKYFFKELINFESQKYINNANIINNYYAKKNKSSSVLLKENNLFNSDINLIDTLKSSEKKDYYQEYKDLKKFHRNSNLKNFFNNNDIIDNNNIFKNNDSISSFKNINYKNTTPRINKNINLSAVRKPKKEYKSPSFYLGTLIRDKSVENKNRIDQNKLFIDSKELNKKFEEIQKRRKILNKFDKNKNISGNKNANDITINHSNISNEFKEIKKFIEEVKKENENLKTKSNNNTISIEKKKKSLIQINTNRDKLKGIKNKDLKNKNTKSVILNQKKEKIVSIRNINGKKYKIMKVNKSKNLKNNDGKKNLYEIKDNNNRTEALSKNKKNNIYYSNKPENEKLFYVMIKNIVSRDGLIHLNINYYFLNQFNKSLKKRYNFLQKSKTSSISILSNKKDGKKSVNFRLSSIKEEEVSIEYSKVYEEAENIRGMGDKHLKEFLEKITKFMFKKYKKNFFQKFKTIELIFKLDNASKNKRNEFDDNNKINLTIKEQKQDNKNSINHKVYSKKILSRTNKNVGKKRLIVNNNKNNYKIFGDRFNKLRFYLIKHYIFNKRSNN